MPNSKTNPPVEFYTRPFNFATVPNVAATSGTDVAATNGTLYYGSIFLPGNVTINGISFLIGSVGGTDKVIVSVHDLAGVLLANSAAAGVTVGTAANAQSVALTTPYSFVGPGHILVGLCFNGTTAKFRAVPAFCSAGIMGGSATQTFGTPATFTPSATAFTADTAPMGAFVN